MPLDKNMSHSEMVAELISTYKKTGKIGATAPRDMEHALEIANAVAYNIGESKEIEIINNEVNEMNLGQILETLEGYLSSKEKELGIVNEEKEDIIIDSSLHKGEEAKYYQENLQGKIVTNPTLGDIQLLGKGRKETLFRSPAKFMGILCYIDKLIEQGYSNGIEDAPDHDRDDSITGFYYIYDQVIYDDKKTDVKITICVDIDGKKYYMFDAESIKESFVPTRLMSKRQSIKEGETSNNIINSEEGDVKPGDKFKLGDFIEITVLEPSVKNYEEALEDGATVKVTLDNGQSFDVLVDKDTKEEEIKKMYAQGEQINIGQNGAQRQARIKEVTMTKPVGEDLEANKYYEIFKNLDLDKEVLENSLKTLKAHNMGPKSQAQIEAIEKILKEGVSEDFEGEEPQAEVIENPINVVSMDIPLLLRILEWAREDSTKDEDLHFLTENLIKAMVNTEFLAMEDYESVIPCCCEETPAEELDLPMEIEAPTEVEESMSEEDMGDMGTDPIAPVGTVQSQIGKTKKGKALKRTYKIDKI